MSAKSDPRDEPAGAEYSYRRTLSAGELLPAIGVGVAAGVVAFYVARLFLQRTPLPPAHSRRRGANRASLDRMAVDASPT
jgi:hypothetical protein